MTFDAPDSNVCCVRRERSNTPLQALTLLNDRVFVECAAALARRVITEGPIDPAQRMRYAFRLCLSREPTDIELNRLAQLWHELVADSKAVADSARPLADAAQVTGVEPGEAAAWVALARTILNLDEFLTRE
jgi:hypothetical protein